MYAAMTRPDKGAEPPNNLHDAYAHAHSTEIAGRWVEPRSNLPLGRIKNSESSNFIHNARHSKYLSTGDQGNHNKQEDLLSPMNPPIIRITMVDMRVGRPDGIVMGDNSADNAVSMVM